MNVVLTAVVVLSNQDILSQLVHHVMLGTMQLTILIVRSVLIKIAAIAPKINAFLVKRPTE